MRHGLRIVATAALLVFGAGTAALASPVPFAVITTDQPGFHIAIGSDFSLRSADQPNPAFPADPVYGNSVPVIMAQLLPEPPVGPLPGYFRMDPLTLLDVLDPPAPGDPVGFVYGPGSFSLALLDLVGPSLVPWLTGTFDSLVLFLYPDVTGFALAPGQLAFSGLSFNIAGLQNPGAAFFELRPLFDPTGQFTGDLMIAAGVFAAEPVPEPATLLLLGAGLSSLAIARRRRGHAGPAD